MTTAEAPRITRDDIETKLRQLKGDAEDMAQTFALDQTVSVPAGVFMHCIASDEWSPLDAGSGSTERKFFAPGIGLVLTVNLGTGEREELVAIH